MKKVEKDVNLDDVYIDKKIIKRIDREISHLGKEKLLVEHIYSISKNYKNNAKNKILFLLVKLYHLNRQVHDSLLMELNADNKLLSKRIKMKMNKKDVHKEIYTKLLRIADKHYKVVKRHADTFNPKKKYSNVYISNIVFHKRRAELIYNTLIKIKMRNVIHKVLLIKLDRVYKSLVEFTAKLAEKIYLMVQDIRKGNVKDVANIGSHLEAIVSNKITVLTDFAYKYTYNIIHSDKFFDFDRNKIILITKKV